MSLELKKSIDLISKERRIDRDVLIDTLEEAVRSAVNKKFNNKLDIEVNFNEETGDVEVYQFKIVTEEIDDPDTEISLEEAQKVDPNVELEDELGFKLHVENLGRIAAQSAKQVIIQRMRDAEQEIIYEEFIERKGEIISGTVQRRDRSGWIVNLGRTEALLPKDEQVPKEHYRRGDRIQGYIIDVKKEGKGPQVILSRSHPDFMAALFRIEVPEISDGTIKIMGIARDPGYRAKIALLSRDRDVDPVGACVGVRGSRINKIVQEFKGERVDIVLWSPDITTYAVNALSPARISSITVDEDEKALEVVVPDSQHHLAIGRRGQNVKLASRLLGWKIDIVTESRYGELYAHRQELENVANVAGIAVDQFYAAGLNSLDDLQAVSDENLLQLEGMDEQKLRDVRSAVNLLSRRTAPEESPDWQTSTDSEAQGTEVQPPAEQDRKQTAQGPEGEE
ncbi:MAG: transcription termination/antitermination protein NusA [Desulfovermiculus sp.]|nr:transcription termination/antitermination protein NusA [Desulfovermiculus sp.]